MSDDPDNLKDTAVPVTEVAVGNIDDWDGVALRFDRADGPPIVVGLTLEQESELFEVMIAARQERNLPQRINEQVALLPHLTDEELEQLQLAVGTRYFGMKAIDDKATAPEIKQHARRAAVVLSGLQTAVAEAREQVRLLRHADMHHG